jgi:MFS transporter, DHA1 family, multidrug resistance protein
MAALVLVTAIGPIAADAYLPALPDLQRDLGTTALGAQLTLTTFLLGLALGQFVCGPVSDAFGRRRFLLAGTAAFLIASVGTVVAQDLTQLLVCRTVQGLAAGCGVAVGRAVVGDCWQGAEAARRYATLSMITMLGPVVAPVLGGLLLVPGTWRWVFTALVVAGVLMVLGTATRLPESLPTALRQEPGLRRLLERQVDLVRDPAFGPHVAVQCLALSTMFTYLGGAALVMHSVYGTSATFFAVVFAVNSLFLATSSTLFRLTVTRVSPLTSRGLGLALMTLFGTVLCGAGVADALGHRPPLAVVWVALMGISLGAGVTLPATLTSAMLAGQRARGAAAGLLSGPPFVCASLATLATGALGHDSVLPLAASMFVLILAASGMHLRMRSAARRTAEG